MPKQSHFVCKIVCICFARIPQSALTKGTMTSKKRYFSHTNTKGICKGFAPIQRKFFTIVSNALYFLRKKRRFGLNPENHEPCMQAPGWWLSGFFFCLFWQVFPPKHQMSQAIPSGNTVYAPQQPLLAGTVGTRGPTGFNGTTASSQPSASRLLVNPSFPSQAGAGWSPSTKIACVTGKPGVGGGRVWADWLVLPIWLTDFGPKNRLKRSQGSDVFRSVTQHFPPISEVLSLWSAGGSLICYGMLFRPINYPCSSHAYFHLKKNL